MYSVDEDLSETIIYKRMSIEYHIADLNEFKESIKEIVNKFIGLSEKWHELLKEKEMLSQKRFAESDEETIKIFENNFVANLKDFLKKFCRRNTKRPSTKLQNDVEEL